MIEVYLPALFVIALIAGIGAYFGSYLREKGKNLATKEDIDLIVRKTEEIKADIAGGLWVAQSRWTFRAEVYKNLFESIGDTAAALRQLMFIDEWRPKLEGNAEAQKFLAQMEKEYGPKAGAAFERLVRTASSAGVWLEPRAMSALEDLKRAWIKAHEGPPSATAFAAKCMAAATEAMEALTQAARSDLQLTRTT
jgi:hypothetical protein